MRTRVVLIVAAVWGYGAALHAQHPDMHMPANMNCLQCHAVEQPDEDNAPLRSCPRPELTEEQAAKAEAEAPDVAILDTLSDVYVPVAFPHKLHALMADMGTQGCATCHHHTMDGQISGCDACHGGPNPVNLRQPSLKGAYHRQCLSCHREWSHENGCINCHAKRVPDAEGQANQAIVDDVVGADHPHIKAPEETVFTVEEYVEGPIVTFNHADHVEPFGLRCVDCHQKESCSNCHDTARPEHAHKPLAGDPHDELCGRCHAPEVKDNCGYCHTTETGRRFNHAQQAGFLLKSYHARLDCRSCHKQDALRFTDLPSGCGDCHGADWPSEDFEHARVGVALDATHAEASCTDCHVEGFAKQVRCGGCHELEWQPGEFEHQRTGEPLDALHLDIECTECHVEGLGKPAQCGACHDDARRSFREFMTVAGHSESAAAGEREYAK